MTSQQDSKTHYRKVFNSPYLSSADIAEPVILTIARVAQEPDKTKKTKDVFNTAHFTETHLRPDEELKPMILNAGNSKVMSELADSKFIEDWANIRVTVYVEPVRYRAEMVDGLKIGKKAPPPVEKKLLTPENQKAWGKAIDSYKQYNSLDKVLAHMQITPEHMQQIKDEANEPAK